MYGCFPKGLNANLFLPDCHRACRYTWAVEEELVIWDLHYRFLVTPGFRVTLRSYVITDVDTENECGVMKTQSAEVFFLLWICVFLIITVVLNLNKKSKKG